MDLTQRKLTKQEWEGIEVPVSHDEKAVLKMIREGYHNTNIKHNNNLSFATFAKLEVNDVMETHIFNTYLKSRLEKIYKKTGLALQKRKIRKTSSKKTRSNSAGKRRKNTRAK
jgi:ATP/maltotriose-dependent transcriptional regulator MalT